MRFARYALGATLILIGAASGAHAATETVLHSFCALNQCGDGQGPQTTLVQDGTGNLYGTASGGAHGEGIVFRLSPQESGDWKYDVLYNFCNLNGCGDGALVERTSLVIDTSGRLYGTAYTGGPSNGDGTVFRLAPKDNGKWTIEQLYQFCYKINNCSDGSHPLGGLTYAGAASGVPYDGTSPLYGVAQDGGQYFGGVAFSLTPNAHGWGQRVLYSFCRKGGTACSDGLQPSARPVLDGDGNLYGTTALGGASPGRGLIYKLSPSGDRKWTETVLHEFCVGGDCAAGYDSGSGLILDGAGNLYGTTTRGGAGGPDCGSGCGALFKLATDGTLSALHTFCSRPNCADGVTAANIGGLVLDAAGNLFGTAGGGGNSRGGGAVFEYTTDGTYQLIYQFCINGRCTDGGHPMGGLLLDSSGTFWGTTTFGGDRKLSSKGTVFKLAP